MGNNKPKSTPPILGFAAYSGTGKTTLLEKIIPILNRHGLRIAIIKHAHHQFDVDIPGKDSYKLRKSGAQQVLVASRKRWALMVETPDNSKDPSLWKLIEQLNQQNIDLILVEGFKNETFDKIELHRASLKHPLLYQNDPNIIAIACDAETERPIPIPRLNLDEPQRIVDFIIKHIQENNNAT